MIEYEGRVFRPPSEAYSLIVQVTIGCSHNKCTFCDMYKEKRFRVRKLEEVKADFDEARRMYRRVGRIFLADGDALISRSEHGRNPALHQEGISGVRARYQLWLSGVHSVQKAGRFEHAARSGSGYDLSGSGIRLG